MRIFQLTLLLTALLTGRIATATSELDKSVDAYVRDEMGRRHIPGLALAVIQQGRIARVSAFGQSSLEFQVPVTPTTLFPIASVTKSFTAVAVMKLAERGEVKLDEPIGAYLEGLPEAWRAVKVGELLSHTSGLPDVVKPNSAIPLAQTPQEAMSLLGSRPLEFAPGSQYRYDQTDYMLLGLLIERISGRSFVQFAQRELFTTAGLTDPQFGDSQTLIRNRAPIYTPYTFDEKGGATSGELRVSILKNAPMLYPNNGLCISVQDIARWLVALMTNDKVISGANLNVLLTPLRLKDGSVAEIPASPFYPWRAYAVGGFLLVPDALHPAAGSTGGPFAAYLFYPKDKFAVAVLTNTQESNPDSLVSDIARRYLAASGGAQGAP